MISDKIVFACIVVSLGLNFIMLFRLESALSGQEQFGQDYEAKLSSFAKNYGLLLQRIQTLEADLLRVERASLPVPLPPPAPVPAKNLFDIDVIVTLPSPIPPTNVVQDLLVMMATLSNSGYSAQLLLGFPEGLATEVKAMAAGLRFDFIEATLVPLSSLNLADALNYCIGLGQAPMVILLPFATKTELRLNKDFDVLTLVAGLSQPDISIVGSKQVRLNDDDEELIAAAGYKIAQMGRDVVLTPKHAGFPSNYQPVMLPHAGAAVDLRGMAFRRSLWALRGLSVTLSPDVRSPPSEHFVAVDFCFQLPNLSHVLTTTATFYLDTETRLTPAQVSAGRAAEKSFYQTHKARLERELSGSYQLPNAAVVWDLYCGCTGLNMEAIGFLYPLEDALYTSALSGPECWCGGQPAAVQATLQRTSTRSWNASRFTFFVSHKPPRSFPTFPYKGNVHIQERPDYVIGRAVSETTAIPEDWVERCNTRVDELWVPTRFQAGVYAASGVRPELLFVIPEAVNAHFFDPATVPAQAGDDGHYRFLSVGKWEPRKGMELLLQAYWSEFKADEKVSLTLHTYLYKHSNPRDKKALRRQLESVAADLGLASALAAGELPPVNIVSEELPTVALPAFYAQYDAFVLATRGEGWGLPIAEAMSMGLPVIVTNFSGPTEYLTKANSFPVPVEKLEDVPADQDFGHAENMQWALPSLPALRRHMRTVFTNPAAARRRGQEARRTILGTSLPNHRKVQLRSGRAARPRPPHRNSSAPPLRPYPRDR